MGGTMTLGADMRIQLGAALDLRRRRGERFVCVRSVPQTMFVDAHERQCERNHGQTLETIRGRGGFDPVEAIAVLSCLPFEAVAGISEEHAHYVLYSMIATHNRGMRVSEQRALCDRDRHPKGEKPEALSERSE